MLVYKIYTINFYQKLIKFTSFSLHFHFTFTLLTSLSFHLHITHFTFTSLSFHLHITFTHPETHTTYRRSNSRLSSAVKRTRKGRGGNRNIKIIKKKHTLKQNTSLCFYEIVERRLREGRKEGRKMIINTEEESN